MKQSGKVDAALAWDDKKRIAALERELAAERIENAHLREAFRTMERAANEREAELDKVLEQVKNLKDELDGIYEREAGASL